MNRFLKPAALVLLLANAGVVSAQVSNDGAINLLPRYGGLEKSRRLRKADETFFAFCDKNWASRPAAAVYHAKRGWDYYYANDFTTAIKRFNQAWLLDSTNAGAYWGFGMIEGQRYHDTDALRYFKRSLHYGNPNKRVFVDIAQAYINLYQLTHLPANLDSALLHTNRFLAVGGSVDTIGTSTAYMHLALVWYFRHDYSSAWKYVDQAQAIAPEKVSKWDFLPALQKAAPR